MDCSLLGSSVHGKNTGVGCHFLLRGIFPTQGSNPALLHCRQILYHLSHQGSLTTSEYDLSGNRVFADVVKLRWGHLGWALIQYDWCPYKKRKFGLRHTQGEYHMKTGVTLPWTEELRGLLAGEAWNRFSLSAGKQSTLLTPWFRPLAPRAVRDWVSVVSASPLVVPCYSSPSGLA